MREVFERYRDIIPDFQDFLKSLHRPLPVHFRVNRLKIEPHALAKIFSRKGIRIRCSYPRDETLFFASGEPPLGKSMEYFLGFIHLQAFTSCIPAMALCPHHNSFVLDMCAAPGGKTAHMAQIMGNSGLIVANELYSTRHIALAATLDRLGVLNTIITRYQAQQFPLRQKFDCVLADVPCSGEGRYRRLPMVRAHHEGAGMARLQELQKKIILRGFDLLKDNGVLLYSTCTYNPLENESVVDYLLKNRDAELLPLHLDLNHDPGITAWKGERYDQRLERTGRFYPHRIDSVGFFMAKISRRL